MKKSNLTGVFVLLIFAVFMASVLLVLLSGVDTVQKLTQRDQRTYHHRTAVQYISTRIRQADEIDAVSTEKNTLILTENLDGVSYETRIYCCNGYLREMFCEAGAALAPDFGEEVLPMDHFQITQENNLIHAELHLPDGSKEILTLLLRSKERGI